MDLRTTYMGIDLKNPLIVGACGLTADINMVKEIEESGASAIVFKSLFEEQIHLEAAELDDDLHEYDDRNAEMISLFPTIEHSGPKAFLINLKRIKEAVSIPVIASLNCVYDVSWVEYAMHLESAGVDGIELNFYHAVLETDKASTDIEMEQLQILKKIKSVVNIPVSVKISAYYSNTLNVVKRMSETGADGVVLFNRLFQPKIDVENEDLKMTYNLSSKNDNRLSLRYTGLLSGNIDASVCASNGVHDAEDVISMLLAGADAVQVVSTLYNNGIHNITNILNNVTEWMKSKGYESLGDFKGKLSKQNMKEPYAYKRAQYVDFLMARNKMIREYSV